MTPGTHCIAFEHGKRLGDIREDEISDVLAREGTFVWVSLHEPDASLLATMKEEFGLHELAIEDASVARQRPKLETYGDMVFIVVKSARLDEHDTDPELAFGEVHLFVGTNYLVSVQHGHALDERRVRERCEHMAPMMSKGPAFVLYALLDFVVDHYQPVIEHFEDEFEQLEKSIFQDTLDRLLIGRVYALKRRILKLRNAALPVANICTELMHLHEDLVPKELRAYFRDVKDHVDHLVAMADSMQDMLSSAMQVNLALVGVSQNDVVKKLAGWGAILAVPTVIFSLYGMNFKWMPELESHWGYPSVIALTLAISSFVYVRLRRADWL